MIDSRARHIIEKPINNIAQWFVNKKVSANSITLFGLLIAILGTSLYYFNIINYLLLLFLWLCGLFDVIDGKIANLTTKTSLGSFLDIVTDRIVEFIFIFVIATKVEEYFYFFIITGIFYISISVFLTSAIISKDTTENKSFHYSTGITERTETFIFISLLILFIDYYKLIITIFSILVIITIIQRVYEVYKFHGKNNEEIN